MTTPTDTALLRRLLASATPGPWGLDGPEDKFQWSNGPWTAYGPKGPVFDDGSAGGVHAERCTKADRDMMIALRNAAPALLDAADEVEKLRAEVADLREGVRHRDKWFLETCAGLDEERADVTRLREALALSEVDVALERSWCRLCRTEGRGRYRGRGTHPHDPGCVLAATEKKP